ncbi:MAG: KH domain-containing protein [Clostridiaceae bacterium]|jgi:predicted RNA-binding protein YlqC (UPF0109 family)|nr:KH domain-containing protein [Clostridiaceae bacterium]
MKELLAYIARQLVDDPDAVSVNQIETEKAITLQLSVAEEDMGKVIGKDGRIAKAIRTVIKAASRNEDKPVYVDIV